MKYGPGAGAAALGTLGAASHISGFKIGTRFISSGKDASISKTISENC